MPSEGFILRETDLVSVFKDIKFPKNDTEFDTINNILIVKNLSLE